MKLKKDILRPISPENLRGSGIEKDIYQDPQERDKFIGVFRNNRRWVAEGEEYDALRPFHESPNFIKAVYYVNQLAEIIMPGVIRHISLGGQIAGERNEDSRHVISGDGFIQSQDFEPLHRVDSIDVYDAFDARFRSNGFELDRLADNIAQNLSRPGNLVYIDTVSPWRYKKLGIAHEHTSKKNNQGLGGFVLIYEPIALYDRSKVLASIDQLSEEADRRKARSWLGRLNILLEHERSLWKKKKEFALASEDSFWEEA